MLSAHLSTLFLIFLILGLSLVTLSVIFGKIGLWLGTVTLSALFLKWVYYEFRIFSKAYPKLSPNLIKLKVGWHQNTCHFLIAPQDQDPISIQFYAFQKPSLLISKEAFEKMPASLLKVTLLYFCEFARMIDSNGWLKTLVIVFSLLQIDITPRLKKTQEESLLHLQKWHGLDPVLTRVRLQQSQYFGCSSLTPLKTSYFLSFPKSLTKGAST
jgi:hypothetical protein